MSRGPLRWFVHHGNPAFTWLWWSQTVSLFGSQVTLVAIPLLAALSLGADAFQMGLLAAVETVPYLAFSLPAGVLADRVDRRGLLIFSSLARAALLMGVPVAAILGFLSLPFLFGIAFGIGCLSVVFDVAYQSYVPDLLPSDDLLAGNQRIEISESAARTVGPGLGGALVATVGGAAAIIVDAASYLLATIGLLLARRPSTAGQPARGEKPAEAGAEAASPGTLDTVWDYVALLERRIGELERRLSARDEAKRRNSPWAGLGLVLRDGVLRDMAASTAIFNLASSAIMAVFILYAARDIGMSETGIGLLIGAGNVGFVVGALAVGAASARFGVGPTLVLSALLGAIATVLLPFAVGPAAVAFLFAGRFVGALGIPLFNVNARALRQSRAPREALGRVNAVFRLIDWGTLPVGSLLGGWIGFTYGLRVTLGMAAVLGVVSALWLVWSPVRRVIGLSDAPAAAERTAVPPQTWPAQPRPVGALSRIGFRLARSLSGIGGLRIRWVGLAFMGLLMQLALAVPLVRGAAGEAAPTIYVVSSVAVLACVVRNLRIPGLAVVALGGAANLLAILANGGRMPVSPEAARAAGHLPADGYTNTLEMTNPVLQPLTDILVVPAGLPLANVYSVGDVLIALGMLITIGWAIRRAAMVPEVNYERVRARLANESTPP